MGLGTTRAEITAAKAEIAAKAASKVDIFNLGAAKALGDPYVLGEEGWGYQWGTPSTTRLDDTDCSGLVYALHRLTDEIGAQKGYGRTLWKDGTTFHRSTAAGYRANAVRVTGEPRTGDTIYFANSTTTYHVALVAWKVSGVWHTVEARRGVEEHTLPELLVRSGCAGLYRFPWLDWGVIVPEPTERNLTLGMTGPDVLAMRERLSLHLGTGYMDLGDYFHEWTRESVRIFQWLRGLTVEGEVGPITQAELAKTPAFPYLAPGVKNRYTGLAVRHLQLHGFAKYVFSPWTDSYGYLLGQEVKKWRASVGLPAGTHLGAESSWPRLIE